MRDVLPPLLQLLFVRQFAVEQEVCDFQVVALFGQLFNRIAAIFEYAFIAVNVCDLALARGCVHERRIVGHQTKVVIVILDLAQVYRADRVVLNRHFILLARAIVGNRQRVLVRAHENSSSRVPV